MATRQNISRAALLGTIDPDYLQLLLADVRHTTASIAGIVGTTPAALTAVLARPAPSPLLPRNWVAVSRTGTIHDGDPIGPRPIPGIVGTAVDWTLPVGSSSTLNGVASIAYAGPEGGYTIGAPLPARADGT